MDPARRLLLLGYGRFGEALATLAAEKGLEVRAHDPERSVPEAWRTENPDQLLRCSGLLVCAVPTSRFRSILESLRPRLGAQHTVVDVGSVKHGARQAMSELCGAEVPWVSTHPLFGPLSIALEERPLRAVVCPDTPHPRAVEEARAFYERLGCAVSEQSSEEHDRTMADTHALAFFVAKALLELGVAEHEVVPPSFRAMSATIESVRADAGHLFFPIQHENPFAGEARERLLDALGRIHRELADVVDAGAGPGESAALAIPPGASTPAELGEARASIDALDRELVELLARRTRLAKRAARAKQREGRAVQDPGRERELLERRRRLAADHALDPEALSDVFEAILRFSRAEQRRWLEGGAGDPL